MKQRTQFDLQRQIELCAMVTVGCSVRAAAEQVGVAESTVRKTTARDPDFKERLRSAQAEREVLARKMMHLSGPKYWRSAAWVLDRVGSEAYDRRRPKPPASEPMPMSDPTDALTQIMTRAVASNDDDRQEVLQLFKQALREYGKKREPDLPVRTGPTTPAAEASR